MPRFRCTAPGCGAVRQRAVPPASCPDKSRCRWDPIADDVVTAAPAEAAPAPPPPPPPPPQASAPALLLHIAGRVTALHGATVLGRNGTVEAEAFRADLGVSRQHCRLERRDGVWTVIALSAATTLLDGRLVPQGHAAPLPAGRCHLRLGDTFDIELTAEDPGTAPSDVGGALDRLLRGGA